MFPSLGVHAVLTVISYCLAVGPFRGHSAPMRELPTDCRNISDIAFLSFYPCIREVGSVPDLDLLEQCDLLAIAAISLAVETVNRDTSILPPGSTLRVIPLEDQRGKSQESDLNGDNMITVRPEVRR